MKWLAVREAFLDLGEHTGLASHFYVRALRHLKSFYALFYFRFINYGVFPEDGYVVDWIVQPPREFILKIYHFVISQLQLIK